jgi:cyclopropane fatty-acyl-phospholipid synthase-like methyltransferase
LHEIRNLLLGEEVGAIVAQNAVMEYVVSDAAERNKEPILQIIAPVLSQTRRLLEIGSGTGTHALLFAARLPHLTWQPTDTGEYLPVLRERLKREGGANLLPVIELDVRNHPWPVEEVDAIYSANTFHIMSWSSVHDFFEGVGTTLCKNGLLCVYGPFRYGDRYTSDSNAKFDRFLQNRDPDSGLRDAYEVDKLARERNLELLTDHAMPANNQLRIWQRRASQPARLEPA